MKRTPLTRRTPLGQGTRGLQRGTTGLARGGRVNPQSERRKAAMEVRRPLVAALLAEFPRCQLRWACQGARAIEVHERLKRSRGGSITDPAHGHMVTVCRACHDLTESHTTEATQRRALLPSWHVCPPVGPC